MIVLFYSFHFLLLKLPNKRMSFPFPPLKLPNNRREEYSKIIFFIPFNFFIFSLSSMLDVSTLSLHLASFLSHSGSLVCSLLSLNPKPIYSNPKSCVVVATTEVGMGVGCHRWRWHGFPSSSSSLFLWSLILFFPLTSFFFFFSLSSLESTFHGGDVAWD